MTRRSDPALASPARRRWTTRAGTGWSADGHSGTYQKDHGYVFEVFPDPSVRPVPVPIKAFGRYAHEALAVSPDRTRVYLSEDASGPNGLFYRWTAPSGVRLGPGFASRLGPTAGRLEAMKIVLDDGSVLPDVAYITSAQLGRPFRVRWVEVPERDGTTTSVRKQFADGQVTRGKKFEGVFGTRSGAYVGPPGTELSTCDAPRPSSASTSVPHRVTVTLSGPSKVMSEYRGVAPVSALSWCGK